MSFSSSTLSETTLTGMGTGKLQIGEYQLLRSDNISNFRSCSQADSSALHQSFVVLYFLHYTQLTIVAA